MRWPEISTLDRLLAKASKDEKTGCLNWTASRQNNGYGQFHLNGAMRLAHRISFELHHGAVPEGMFVLHKCDNRICINPDHLFVGTQAENLADMVAKGRQANGISNGHTRLRDQDVIAIRRSVGVSQADLARSFGTTSTHIRRIRSGENWSHLKDTGK